MNVGAARTRLTPPWGVELAGWGYYLGRTWKRVRDHTAATAVVVRGERDVAIVGVDLMYADAAFCGDVRARIHRETGIAPEAICVAASHSHNTPTAARIRGGGEPDAEYVAWAARQAATAAVLAFRAARLARLFVGATELSGWTVNRSRADGPVDRRLSVWRFEDDGRRPLAAVVNFAGHPTAQMVLGSADVSRDYPGQVTDLLERELPGVTALFLQGACGEINVKPECHDADRCHTPGVAVAQAALQAWRKAIPSASEAVGATESVLDAPTRPWSREEIDAVRDECARRLATGDTAGWLEGFARAVVNVPARLPERYGGSVEAAVRAVSRFGVEWAEAAGGEAESVPMRLQALRVGDGFLAANGAEFFSSHAAELRRRWGRELIVAGYANESVGYLPDADDVRRGTYAAAQSPKFKGQRPFTADAGDAVVAAMHAALGRLAS